MRTLISTVPLAALLLLPAAALAQDGGSIGIGPRITVVRGSEDSPDGTQHFTGGVLRLGGGRSVIELAMDYRSGVSGSLTERIKDYPIQASLLLFPVRARVAPYVLGGVGWYSQQVTRFSGPTGTVVASEETTRRMGYHAGFGGEVRLLRRLALYGDYRYTRVTFGNSDGASSSIVPSWLSGADRLKLSHDGSMFTWGAAFYF